MFRKPISQLTEEDIQFLVENKEAESSILEYKKEVVGTDHEKKEIAKDISAMANAEGGYLIFGIDEEGGKAKDIVGTPIVIGRQPVEMWIENILISNVRPKIAITPKVITLAGTPERVVVLIHIPQSSRRPHMVIADGRNAYYVRHNYQATYADEHEVRSMFSESKNAGEEMKNFLASRNLQDPLASHFAITPLSSKLTKSFEGRRNFRKGHANNPFVLFTACPRYLEERVDIASSDFRYWLDKNEKVNLFGLNLDFLDYDKTVSADSISSIKSWSQDEKNYPYRYVEVFRNGYVENGIGEELMWSHEKLGLMFQIAYFSSAFWLFLKFIRDLYEKVGYLDEINITIALAGMEDVVLHGFGKKNERERWVNPYEGFGFNKKPICKQNNVKIERSIIASELNDENIEKMVKEVAVRVSNAFGEAVAKCFDESGSFDRDQLRGFRNVK